MDAQSNPPLVFPKGPAPPPMSLHQNQPSAVPVQPQQTHAQPAPSSTAVPRQDLLQLPLSPSSSQLLESPSSSHSSPTSVESAAETPTAEALAAGPTEALTSVATPATTTTTTTPSTATATVTSTAAAAAAAAAAATAANPTLEKRKHSRWLTRDDRVRVKCLRDHAGFSKQRIALALGITPRQVSYAIDAEDESPKKPAGRRAHMTPEQQRRLLDLVHGSHERLRSMSSDQISEELGFVVARRTVARYLRKAGHPTSDNGRGRPRLFYSTLAPEAVLTPGMPSAGVAGITMGEQSSAGVPMVTQDAATGS